MHGPPEPVFSSREVAAITSERVGHFTARPHSLGGGRTAIETRAVRTESLGLHVDDDHHRVEGVSADEVINLKVARPDLGPRRVETHDALERKEGRKQARKRKEGWNEKV